MVRDCDWEPAPFAKLQGLPVDMNPVMSRTRKRRDAVWAEIAKGIRRAAEDISGGHQSPALAHGPVLHPDIRPTPSFTGRTAELANIDAALRAGGVAAVTQPAAVHGLGGVGKSTLARQYAWTRVRLCRGVVAQRGAGAGQRQGRRQGPPGRQLRVGRHRRRSRRARRQIHPKPRPGAGPCGRPRRALDFIAGGRFAKPWLLVYDNADNAAVLRHWPPSGMSACCSRAG